MSGFVMTLLTAFFAASVSSLIFDIVLKRSLRTGDHHDKSDAGRIKPSRKAIYFCVLVGGILFFSGAAFTFWALLILEGVERFYAIYGLMAGLMGAVIGFPPLLYLTDAYDVTWTSEGLEGPSKFFGPFQRRKRLHLRWENLKQFGRTEKNYWFVENEQGQRIYWNMLYHGHQDLHDAVRQKRPDINLPY